MRVCFKIISVTMSVVNFISNLLQHYYSLFYRINKKFAVIRNKLYYTYTFPYVYVLVIE